MNLDTVFNALIGYTVAIGLEFVWISFAYATDTLPDGKYALATTVTVGIVGAVIGVALGKLRKDG